MLRNNLKIHLFCLLGLYAMIAAGQVFRSGASCPQPQVQKNFDIKKFSAQKWYEIERYFAIFELGVRCVTATFDPKSDQDIQMSFQATEILSGLPIAVNLTGSIMNPEEAAKISVSFMPGLNLNTLNFWVLETDYDNYAVIWSCANFASTRLEFGWIMSRKSTLEKEKMAEIYEHLHSADIQTRDFIKSDHTDCENERKPNVTDAFS